MASRHWFATSAILGGVILLLTPVAYYPGWLVRLLPYEYLMVVSPVLLLFGLYGYYREYRVSYTWKGKVGTVLAGIGFLGIIPILAHRTITTYTLPHGVLLISVAIIGIVLLELGVLALSIDVWQSKAMNQWLWPVVALGLPVGFVMDYALWTISDGRLLTPLWWGVRWYPGIYGAVWVGLGSYLFKQPGSEVNGSEESPAQTVRI